MGLILTEQRGAVAILTLNNPEKYNALGGAMLPELLTAFDSVASDPAVRAILLTGAERASAEARSSERRPSERAPTSAT